MLDSRDLAGLRREYLFGLAHVCHLSPAQVDALSLGDFAVLIENTDQWAKAQQQQPPGG